MLGQKRAYDEAAASDDPTIPGGSEDGASNEVPPPLRRDGGSAESQEVGNEFGEDSADEAGELVGE
eukprot:7270276-Prymnesium_polylepis.1